MDSVTLPADSAHSHEHELFPRTSLNEARLLLNRALKEIPRLTYFGVGIPKEATVRREKGKAFVRQETSRQQARLLENLREIAICADWSKRITPIRTVNRSMHSGGHKHRVESWCRRQGHNEYIANGSLIAAAVGLGFPFRIDPPHVEFAFSRTSLRELSGEDTAPPDPGATAAREPNGDECPRCGRPGEPAAVTVPGLPCLVCRACRGYWTVKPTAFFPEPLSESEYLAWVSRIHRG